MTQDNTATDLATPSWGGPSASPNEMPVLATPGAPSASAAESAALLRRFHHGAAVTGFETPDGIAPALLFPLRAASESADGGALTAELLDAAARRRADNGRADFRDEVATLVARLRGLLEVESGKDPEARGPEALGRAMGGSGTQHFDPEALARVLGPRRGSAPTSRLRRRRLENALAVLRGYLAGEPPPVLTLIVDGSFEQRYLPPHEGWATVEDPAPCERAAAIFDREAARLVDVFRARRTALLELEGVFDEEHHQPWLDALDWQSLSRDEIQQVRPVVAVETAERLVGGQLPALTKLLVSGRPVQVLVWQSPAHNATARSGDPLSDYRLEVGYLGMGHRQALVQQSTAACPEHLAAGLARSMAATRASLHVLASEPGAGSDKYLAAATEARAHPVFSYDPGGGSTWARRLDFDGNAQPAAPWPVYPLSFRREDGSVGRMASAFTFADFALLEPDFRAHFAVVPDGCPDGIAVPVANYLELGSDETTRPLPFVWGVRADGGLVRLVVTRQLALACQDRAGFWRTLQELAGVHNEHVEAALREARDESASVDQEQRSELEATHRSELERAREDAIGDAMRNLAASLLAVDPDAFVREVAAVPAAAAATPLPAATEAAAEPVAAAASEPVATAAVAEGPWIETALCTSCNDCVQISKLLFVYDENKQAHIGDARAGTFAQIVKAAEKCPARCIHPGEPLNAGEAGLEALRRRAAPFND